MPFQWTGMEEFLGDLRAMPAELETCTTAHSFATARRMRQSAMDNMSTMGIGLITGRSRALYGVALSGTTALAGYIRWDEEVEFYPEFLNNGTSRMDARPYHDLAFEQQETFFIAGMERCLEKALAARGSI